LNVQYPFDEKSGELKIDPVTLSLQRMDPNCKPVHARAYPVPRSVEQQLQQSKEIV
jgi:hypothetical protein